jgi:predicted ATPase
MVSDAVHANADESLLNMAAKAHGNPFLVSELVGGLDEGGRINVSGGRAVASGHALPRRLGAGMQQRLDHLSTAAGEVVRVAAVLPDRFSAALGCDAGTPASAEIEVVAAEVEARYQLPVYARDISFKL